MRLFRRKRERDAPTARRQAPAGPEPCADTMPCMLLPTGWITSNFMPICSGTICIDVRAVEAYDEERHRMMIGSSTAENTDA